MYFQGVYHTEKIVFAKFFEVLVKNVKSSKNRVFTF